MMNSGFQGKTGLDCHRLTEKEVQKKFKKLLTNESECDTINKSPRESESSGETTGTLKIKQRKRQTRTCNYFEKSSTS